MRAPNGKSGKPSRTLNRTIRSVLFYVLLAAVMIPFFFPFYWLLATSLKNELDVTAIPPRLLFQPTLDNYVNIFANNDILHYAINSAIVALGACAIGLVFGLTASFGIARFRMGRFALVVLLARIIPGMCLLLPWFILFQRTGLNNTYLGLILVHSIITLPLTIWILVGFFEDVPTELVDAAMIDGCSLTGALWRVILPIVMPGIVVAFILGFVGSWNEFLFSAILSGINTQTLPVVAYKQITPFLIDYGGIAAAAIVLTLPVLLLTLAVQKYVVKGLSLGAVKG